MYRRFIPSRIAHLRRPRALAVTAGVLLVLGLGGYLGGRQAWAWYHLREGQRELDRHHPHAAYRHLGRALEVWPESSEIHRKSARAARQMGDLETARTHLLLGQRHEDPPSEEAVLEWALYRAESGDLATVEQFLRPMVTGGHPDRMQIAEALTRGYLKALRLLDALAMLEGWVREDPGNPAAYSLRGRLWTQVRAFSRAVEDYDKAVRLDPDRDADRLGLALALIEVSRYQDSIPQLERLRGEDPDDQNLATYLAFALGRVGRADEAVALLDGVLARNPNHLAALTGHARLDLESGRDADAERYARRALAVNRYDRSAAHVLHQSLVGQGRPAEAAEAKARLQQLDDLMVRYYDLANRLIPQQPKNPDLQYQLGEVLLALGQKDQAERWWLSATRINPAHADAHRALAEYYEAEGRSDLAKEHLRAVSPEK